LLLEALCCGLPVATFAAAIIGFAALGCRIDLLPFLNAASDLFMVAVASGSLNSAEQQADTLVGYTCGTLTTADALTHESMSRHDPEGQTLCIHSVSVAAENQRKGIARRMLKAYLQYVQQTSPQIQSVQLICKEVLIPLYVSAGFTLVEASLVVHGQDQWFDMRVAIH